jgi:hypothetical protein
VVIELMLAHVPKNHVKAAYGRAGNMERRRELTQEWSDLLMKGMVGATDLLDGTRSARNSRSDIGSSSHRSALAE